MENITMKIPKLILLLMLITIGCASAPRVFPIPTMWEAGQTRTHRLTDYPEALAAIVSVMSGDLGFPAVEGTVRLYPNSMALESALAVELERDFQEMAQLIEKQLGPQAKERFHAQHEGGVALAARQMATTAVVVSLYKRILVNELLFFRYPWSERIRVLAHELTHIVQKAVVNGLPTTTDQWLTEGFADWVSYSTRLAWSRYLRQEP
jgi:hypothetical protein